MPVGIFPTQNEKCSNHNSKIKNEKCHDETKPIIPGSSVIDPPGAHSEPPKNRFKSLRESYENFVVSNNDNTNKKCKCNSKLILLFIILFIVLLLLNFFIF